MSESTPTTATPLIQTVKTYVATVLLLAVRHTIWFWLMEPVGPFAKVGSAVVAQGYGVVLWPAYVTAEISVNRGPNLPEKVSHVLTVVDPSMTKEWPESSRDGTTELFKRKVPT